MSEPNYTDKRRTSFCIALTGILAAVAFLFCFLAGISPVAGISLLAIASFFIGILILETNIRYATAGWLVTSILALLFVSQKLMAIPAALFFLPYPIVKKLIEKDGFIFTTVGDRKAIALKWVAKLLFFIVSFAVSYVLLVKLFGVDYVALISARLTEFNINISADVMYIIIAVFSVAVFIIYDILFSMLGRQYIFKYSRLLRGRK